jgi:mono/diheme cytochrome c family protein
MLSLTNEQMGAFYASVRLIPSPAYGRQLFVEKNCLACHRIGGVGSREGPDLMGVTTQHSIGWLDEQLVNPDLVSPGSAMPSYDLSSNEQKAIIGFLASATAEDAKAILAGRPRLLNPSASEIAAGKESFTRFGCVGCHGIQLQGGVPNPNSQGGEVPSLLHVAQDYTKEEVTGIIRDGKIPPSQDVTKAPPPLYMPSWKNVLTKEDINRIVAYLWAMQPKNAESW